MSRAAFVLALVACTLLGSSRSLIGQGRPGAAPFAEGCISDVTSGDHTFMCGGLRVDARVPPACLRPGCGLILEVHGDTGTGLLEDAHTKLRDLGAQHGYIVVAPTGPSRGGRDAESTWSVRNDTALVDIVRQFAAVFRVDAAKIHATGFSRGGFVTWRMLCDHADLFASVAPAGASDGRDRGEVTCFSNGRAPSRTIPILLLMGRTDRAVFYPPMVTIRDAAIKAYGATNKRVLSSDAAYSHTRWTSPGGATIEAFDHAYETIPNGPWGFARGHCFPGSTVDPHAPQYALACKPPNSFVWGDEVMRFFVAHAAGR